MEDFTNRATGYRIEDENHGFLVANAQPPEQYAFGDVNPRQLGNPIGMIDILNVEDQGQISSCAGNSATTILESCLWLQGNVKVQLSRMFAYVNGQQRCGITGDNGATLEGVIRGLTDDGCPEEPYCKYTGSYFTRLSAEAREHASQYKLKSWSAIDIHNPDNGLQQIYEGLAKRIGGLFIGIPCTSEIYNAPADGILDYYSGQRAGGHAMGVVDWCTEKDSDGYPYLLLANSWSKRYGYRGYRKVRPAALKSMMRAPNASFYFLSDMEFIKPRYDWKSQQWVG